MRALISVVILSVALAGCSEESKSPSVTPVVGDPFPNLRISGVNGELPPLENLRGKVVVINIWAPWCAPCLDEMPSLEALYQKLDKSRAAVVGITVDDRYLAQEFLNKKHITFTSYFDRDRSQVEGELGVNSYPQTFIVDPDGIIRARIIGWQSWDDAGVYKDLMDLASR